MFESQKKFAVLDIETNYSNKVMSIGLVAARCMDLQEVDSLYLVITPYWKTGGIFSDSLWICREAHQEVRLDEAIRIIASWLEQHEIEKVFAYNGRFDQSYLAEPINRLRPASSPLVWHDIMRLAAYRQFNPSIQEYEPCCKTGRLKRGYGVEPVLQRLRGSRTYRETHNALLDARDELEIMQRLGHPLSVYELARI